MRIFNKIKPIALALLFMASINLVSAQGGNPFVQSKYWADQPSMESIKADMAKGHSVTEANSGGYDATSYAILNSNPLSTVKFLLEQGNPVNKKTHDSRTYIFWAASRVNIELMEYLVSQGAKTDISDSYGNTLGLYSASGGKQSRELYDFLEKQGMDLAAEKTSEGKNILHMLAPRLTDYEMLDYFQQKGVDLHEIDQNGNGIFNYAARSGNIELLKELISRGVKYGENKVTGENAILMASSNGENGLEYFKYLEGLGLNPAVVTTSGTSALHMLSRSNRNLEVYNYFLSKGLDVNAADSNGNTALINAAGRNNLAVVAFLSEKTKDVNHTNKEGQSALTMAVLRNSPEVVDNLIAKSANVNLVDAEDNTLSHYLVRSYRASQSENFDQKLNALTAKGLDLSKKQGDNSTLLHLAIDQNDMTLLKKLSPYKIDVNAKNKEGITALHLAAMKSSNVEMLKYLIALGADKKSTTDFEETAYDLAKENEKLSSGKVDLSFLKAL